LPPRCHQRGPGRSCAAPVMPGTRNCRCTPRTLARDRRRGLRALVDIPFAPRCVLLRSGVEREQRPPPPPCSRSALRGSLSR
jgi:hypothetical protein